MKQLLLREWVQYKSATGWSMLWVWVIYLIAFIIGGSNMLFMLLYLPVIMGYSVMLNIRQQGEAVRQGSEDFLLPVPLGRVIRARYLFIFGVFLLSSVLVTGVVAVGRLLGDISIDPVMVFGSCMGINGIMLDISMPLLYRWGAARSRIYMILVLAVSASVGAMASIMLEFGMGQTGHGLSANVGCLAGAVLVWCLSPLSVCWTVKMYRKGGVDHEKKPILEG